MLADFREAARRLWRTRGFTATAVLTLALGIGVTTAFYAVEDAAVFRPLRTAHLDNVYNLMLRDRRYPMAMPLTNAQFRAIERQPPVGVLHAAILTVSSVIAKLPGRTEEVRAEVVSGSATATFSVRTQAGRFIDADDDRLTAAPVVVLSDRLWRDWLAGSTDLIGRTSVSIGGIPHTIIGVAAPGFEGMFPFTQCDLWLPYAAFGARKIAEVRSLRPDAVQTATAYVRLADGVTPARVEPALRAAIIGSEDGPEPLISLLTTSKDRPPHPVRPRLTPDASAIHVDLGSSGNGAVMPGAMAILVLSGLVLLAACANLSNLLFARASERAGEVAVRLSLGASASKICRLFFAEAAIISALAALAGLALAVGATYLLGTAIPLFGPGRWNRLTVEVTPSVRVALYAVGTGTISALLVGALAGWRASHLPPGRTLASAGAAMGMTRRGRTARVIFVVIQVTVAVVLITGASNSLANMAKVLARRIHFDTAPLSSASLHLPREYTDGRAHEFFDRVLQAARRDRSVQGAALASGLPGATYARTGGKLFIADKDDSRTVGDSEKPWMDAGYHRVSGELGGVSPEFLSTIGLPLRQGRDFRATDADGAPLVAIVSEAAAAQLWPNRNPIGRRVMFGLEGKWWTVIGVCADPVTQWDESPLLSPSNLVLVPFDQRFQRQALVILRSTTPMARVELLRTTVHALDEDLPVYDASTVDELILSWVRPLRAAAALMGSLVVLSLTIAALGIYGVMSYLVSIRTREFGIRLALGAAPRRLVLMAVSEARLLILIGLLPGVWLVSVGSAFGQNRLLQGFMPTDISTWFAVPALILAIGLAAAYIPARRAARVDPNSALREL